MIPRVQNIELKPYSGTTYKLVSYEKLEGTVDGAAAVAQSIYFILNTPRYAHAIYSWDYGIDLTDLLGTPANYPEIKRRLVDALRDDRIASVGRFEFSREKHSVCVRFVVTTLYGDLTVEVTL